MVPKNPTIEHDIQNEIRIWCGEHGIAAIRQNVGTFRDLYSDRVINSGPPKGWPDLQLLDNNGHTMFCECKARYGRLSDDQKKIHRALNKRGFIVIVPKSVEAFIKEIQSYEWFK